MRSVLISTKPFIFDLFLVGVTVQSAESLSPAIPLGTSTKEQILKEQITDDHVFFKMPFCPCPLGCGRFLSADDGHDHCLQCLGIQHTEAAFVDDSCTCCGPPHTPLASPLWDPGSSAWMLHSCLARGDCCPPGKGCNRAGPSS